MSFRKIKFSSIYLHGHFTLIYYFITWHCVTGNTLNCVSAFYINKQEWYIATGDLIMFNRIKKTFRHTLTNSSEFVVKYDCQIGTSIDSLDCSCETPCYRFIQVDL